MADTLIEIIDNVFVRMFELRRVGDVQADHAHVFDHITLLARGSVAMRMQGYDDATKAASAGRRGIDLSPHKVYAAPCLIVTPKGISHEFEALSDDCLLCCIHAIRDGDGLDDIAPQEITSEQAAHLMQLYPLVQIPEGTRDV